MNRFAFFWWTLFLLVWFAGLLAAGAFFDWLGWLP